MSPRVLESWTLGLCLMSSALLASQAIAGDELVTGRWQVTVSEVSNTCGDDPPEPGGVDVELHQSSPYVLMVPETPVPNLTELAGTVSGQSISLGFEVFEDPGITIVPSADNSLAIAQDFESFSGNVSWKFYTGVDCSGVDSFSAVRLGAAPEENSLTGNWRFTLSGVSETCGDGLGSPAVFDSEAVQFDDEFVRFTPPPVPGLGEVVGTVSGLTLKLGLEVQEDGGVTVYDSADNDLAIAPDFDSFSGNAPWTFYFPLECTGVDHLEAVFVPEPGPAALGFAVLTSVGFCTRRRRARNPSRA